MGLTYGCVPRGLGGVPEQAAFRACRAPDGSSCWSLLSRAKAYSSAAARARRRTQKVWRRSLAHRATSGHTTASRDSCSPDPHPARSGNGETGMNADSRRCCAATVPPFRMVCLSSATKMRNGGGSLYRDHSFSEKSICPGFREGTTECVSRSCELREA